VAAEDPRGCSVVDMRWLMEFYHQQRGILARYGIEAPLPGAAVVLGWRALFSEYPPTLTRRRRSLFRQAQRVEGQDPSGWLLYRIVRDDAPGPVAAPRPAA
jgi:hypothetical protein